MSTQPQPARLATFLEKVGSRTAKTGIIGLGYVGLPLALLYSEQKFVVTGFDIDQKKIDAIANGGSYIVRIPAHEIKQARDRGFTATADYARIAEMDAIIICVPTPLNEYHEPDLSYIVEHRQGHRSAPARRPIRHSGEHDLSWHHRGSRHPYPGKGQ